MSEDQTVSTDSSYLYKMKVCVYMFVCVHVCVRVIRWKETKVAPLSHGLWEDGLMIKAREREIQSKKSKRQQLVTGFASK